jgi:hypothetical protein
LCQYFGVITKDVRPNYNLSGDEDPDGDLSPQETMKEKKCPPAIVRVDPHEDFFFVAGMWMRSYSLMENLLLPSLVTHQLPATLATHSS